MTAIVHHNSTGKNKEVKNLGWLLRRKKEVLSIEAKTTSIGQGYVIFVMGNNTPEKEYRTVFHDENNLRKFLKDKFPSMNVVWGDESDQT